MSGQKPTDSELDILNVLWEHGPSTVRNVHEIIEKEKPSGYTTTLKLMQIMHQKEFVSRDTSSKTHVYKALLNKEATQGRILKKMVDTMFNGSTMSMVMQALGNHKANSEELDEIKKYLNNIENK